MQINQSAFLDFEKEIHSYRLKGAAKKLIELANEFLIYLELRGLSLQTVRAYGYDLVSLIRWLAQTEISLAALDQRTFLRYIEVLSKEKLSPASINRRISTSQLFYQFILGHRPPWQSIPIYRRKRRFQSRTSSLRVKNPKYLIEPLSPNDIHRLIEKVRRYRDLAIISLMLFLGLRSIEIRNLKISDINREAGTLRVIGKGDKERALPLAVHVGDLLNRYFRLERPKTATTDRLFVVLKGAHTGSPLTAPGLRSLFRYFRKISGVKKANPHRFRHTFGVEMARAGVKLPTLQKMMGHSEIETTLRYINLSMKDVAEEYEKAIKTIQGNYDIA